MEPKVLLLCSQEPAKLERHINSQPVPYIKQRVNNKVSQFNLFHTKNRESTKVSNFLLWLLMKQINLH
jgi:hypothetical protein